MLFLAVAGSAAHARGDVLLLLPRWTNKNYYQEAPSHATHMWTFGLIATMLRTQRNASLTSEASPYSRFEDTGQPPRSVSSNLVPPPNAATPPAHIAGKPHPIITQK